MAAFEDFRVYVGGLSWDTSDKSLEHAFRRFGKVMEAKAMLDRESGRPRGFGFVTFADEQSMEDAIAEMHGRELDGRIVSVSKAQPKFSGAGVFGYHVGYEHGTGRSGYPRASGGGGDNCFNCGKPGHWARECPFHECDGGRFPPKFGGGAGRFDENRFGGGGSSYGGRGQSGGLSYGGRDRGGGLSYGGHDRDGDLGYGGRDRGGGFSYGDRYGNHDRGQEQYGFDKYGLEQYDGYIRDGRGGCDQDNVRGGGGSMHYERGGYKNRSAPYDRRTMRSTYSRY